MKNILRSSIFLALLMTASLLSHATNYYVDDEGNDANFGTQESPWKTIGRALNNATGIGDKIYVGVGTIVETGPLNIPVGVSIIGSGIGQTIIKGAGTTLLWDYDLHRTEPGADYAKHFLISANSTGNPSTAPQSFENFTIDGNGKQLHGGIIVVYRSNVLVQNVKVLETGFCGIWFFFVQNSIIRNVQTKDCSWSNGWSSGAIQVGNVVNVEIDNVNIDENEGYGIKSLPNSSSNSSYYISGLNIHHSSFSVSPESTWGTSANITLELLGTEFPNCQIHHNTFDNILSLVNVKISGTDFPHHATTPGMKVFDNTFNLLDSDRSEGFGYGLECSINDVEIYGNKFNGGDHGIVSFEGHKHYNWKIHRNYFHSLDYAHPTSAVHIDGGNEGQGSVEDLTIVNNTMEMTNSSSVNFFSAAKQGQTKNVVIKNNLIINNRPTNSGNQGELNRVIRLADNASINTLTMQNNNFVNIPAGNTSDLNKITLGNISSNTTVAPSIIGSGNRPLPYYELTFGSSLINAGSSSFSPNTAPSAYTFSGPNPDIGAFEYSAATIPVSSVSLSPSNPSIQVNNTVQLTAAINPSNATNQTIASWVSSNTTVATVSGTGLVTGHSTGQTTITVTTQDGNKTATAAVTVTASTAGQNLIVNPEFDNGTTNWSLGNWVGPNYSENTANTLTPATGAALSGTNSARLNIVSTNAAQWTLQLNQGIPLLQNGKTYEVSFMAKADANRTIIATAHGSNPADFDYSPYTANLTTSAQTFSYTFTYGGTTAHTQFTLAFYVAHATSTADVWIDKVSFRDITNLVLVNSVSVTPTTASIAVGATQQLTVTVLPANATNKNVAWSSSNTNIATVSATGLVSAHAAGTATITATSESNPVSGTSAITVTQASAPTPLVRLNFNEVDGSSTSNSGTAGGNFILTPDKPTRVNNVPAGVGGARALDYGTTSGNYAVESAQPIAALGGLQAFTITGWLNCKNSTVGAGGNRVVSWINHGGDGVDLVYLANGSLRLGVDAWPDAATNSSPAISNPNKITTDALGEAPNWVFFAVTYRSTDGRVQFYFGKNSIPATLDVTRTYNQGVVGNNIHNLSVGHFNSASRTGRLDRMFKGLIDEIQVHGTVLTDQQIQSIQSQTPPANNLKINYTISNGLQIQGVDQTNPVIYDNDMTDDTPEDEFLWLKAHNGQVNLVGNVVTRDMDLCSTGACKRTMQFSVDQFEKALNTYARPAMLQNIPLPVAGSDAILTRPQSGNIDDTTPKPSTGSNLIVTEARKASAAKPLVIFVGGNATTVANAYLTDHSIADKIVVVHVYGYHDRYTVQTSYNTTDPWSAYIAMKKMRYINFTGDLRSWYGKPPDKDVGILKYVQGGQYDPRIAQMNSTVPNPVTNSIKLWYETRFNTECMGDAPPVLYFYNHSLWKNVVRKLENGQTTTSDTFDYLMISENDWTNYGPNLIDYLKIPSNYPNGGSGGGGSSYSSQFNEEYDDVYPNPVKRGEVLHLRVPEGAPHLKVIDALGRVKFVFAPVNNNVEISTAELNGGLYFVQYKKGNAVKQVKFIIE